MTRVCAACGHPARPGDPLRFYRIEVRYGTTGRFGLTRRRILRVHRSHNMRKRRRS